jgi:hypothetical protein
VTFLSPLFLVGAATAAIPLILHLLKREPEPRVKFAAVKLLKNAPVELTEKRHLRELLLLALRVAAVVLLALAFARPFFASGAALGSGRVAVIAIDTSYSLSAPGRMERARELAKQALDRVPLGDRVGVVTFSDIADVVARPSADRAFAAAAIEGAASGYGATRYRVGLNAAAQALDGAPGTIVVVTDLQESGWDVGDRASVPESTHIEVVDVGAPPPNLAITSLRLVGDRIVASIHNSDTRPRETHVRLTLDGRAGGDAPITVGPGASAEAAFAARAGAAAQVAIDDSDGWQADNVRYLVLDASSRPTVVAVTATGDPTRDAFYVQHALAAGGGYQVVGVSGAQLASTGSAIGSPAAVLILSTRGLERHGREALASYVRSGGGMLIAAGPDIDGEVIADVIGGAPLRIVVPTDPKPSLRTLAPADVRHPIFQPFGAGAAMLGLVKFQTVSRIGGPDCQALARFTSGEPALLDCSAGEGRAMVIASDLNNRWNDFPLHPSFVAFLHEAVRYLSSARPQGNEYLIGDAPAGVPRTPGIVTVPATGGRPRRVAVNVDPRETDSGRVSSVDFEAAVTRLKDVGASEARVRASEEEERQHLWQYLLVLMLVALAFEGAVASRTG